MLKKNVLWLTLLTTTSAAVTEIFVFRNTDIWKSDNIDLHKM